MLTFALGAMSFYSASAQADPNCYVYLCLGQSNMEGNANIEAVDQEYVDERFQMVACVNFTNPARQLGEFYTAYPPIVRPWTGLGMADYFGRSMVAALPRDIKVCVVDVAIGGVDIKGFMSEEVPAYLETAEDWLKASFAAYENDPYKRLVDMAKKAQQKGVIKGILLHQGETNTGQQDWPQKVKTVYERLLSDLGLRAADVPLFVGEVVSADQNGQCASHNSIINNVPNVIPTAHVVHSQGCPVRSDRLHFTAAGYRTMGKRYAMEALKALGQPAKVNDSYTLHASLKNLYTATGLEPIADITLRPGYEHKLDVKATFLDGHVENVSQEAVVSATGPLTVNGTTIKTTGEGQATATVSYTDFTGQTVSTTVAISVN